MICSLNYQNAMQLGIIVLINMHNQNPYIMYSYNKIEYKFMNE